VLVCLRQQALQLTQAAEQTNRRTDMTPIVVAIEVDSNGTPVKEAFVVISKMDTVEDTVKRLRYEFGSGAYKRWSGQARVECAQRAVDAGNTLEFRAFLF